jgi:hypothetical protein
MDLSLSFVVLLFVPSDPIDCGRRARQMEEPLRRAEKGQRRRRRQQQRKRGKRKLR